MRVAPGVEALDVSATVMGARRTIHPTLIWDDSTAILVDAGYPGLLPQIRGAVENAGVPFGRLNRIILTHHDLDHIGSLPSVIEQLPQPVEALSHEDEKPYVEGEKRPLKLVEFESRLQSLPDEMKAIYEMIKAGFSRCQSRVDRTLADGEELPYCGGITVIHTPGHTLGHICLYLRQCRVLVAGDALTVDDGILTRPSPLINHDTALCGKSLRKLARHDIDTVICYHGGIYRGGANERIAELAGEA